MSALPVERAEVRLEDMHIDRLDQLCAVEQTAYAHPWSRANFIDSLHAGYRFQVLLAPALSGGAQDTLIGYFIAMHGADEVHLLNITVAPPFQRQGWSLPMLQALTGWSRGQGAQWLWLEVRASNARALQVYDRHGFQRVGLRKAYYPVSQSEREDAIVMSLRLQEPGSEAPALP